jgi:hypothetical protein
MKVTARVWFWSASVLIRPDNRTMVSVRSDSQDHCYQNMPNTGLRLAGSVDRVVGIHLINAVSVTLCHGPRPAPPRAEHPHLGDERMC